MTSDGGEDAGGPMRENHPPAEAPAAGREPTAGGEPSGGEPSGGEPSGGEPSGGEPSGGEAGGGGQPAFAAVWTPVPPRAPKPPPKPRPWIVVAVVLWVAVLAAGVGWALAKGGPTAREQSTVAQALPAVDRAAAEIVTAATSDGQAVAAISDLSRAADCTITVVRSGQRYQRVVTAFVAPGTEPALLGRVADRLPASYGATVRKGNAARMTADAGFYVGVVGTVAAPGTVRFVIDTGDCRAPGDIPPMPAVEPTPAQRAPVETALSWLGIPATAWHLYRAACPGGGDLVTVEAEGAKGTTTSPLTGRMRPAGGSVAVATPDLFAYTQDSLGVAARILGDTVVITATTPCGGR